MSRTPVQDSCQNRVNRYIAADSPVLQKGILTRRAALAASMVCAAFAAAVGTVLQFGSAVLLILVIRGCWRERDHLKRLCGVNMAVNLGTTVVLIASQFF